MLCNPANGRVDIEELSAYKNPAPGGNETLRACQPTETNVPQKNQWLSTIKLSSYLIWQMSVKNEFLKITLY